MRTQGAAEDLMDLDREGRTKGYLTDRRIRAAGRETLRCRAKATSTKVRVRAVGAALAAEPTASSPCRSMLSDNEMEVVFTDGKVAAIGQ